jgi:phage gpG-like protein
MVIDSGDAVMQRILSELKYLAAHEAAVGILQGKGAEEEHAPGLTMAQLGAIHEFGAPEVNIPERSFLRHTADARKDDLSEVVTVAIGTMFDGKLSGDQVLAAAGVFLATATQEYIREGEGPPPPLSPITIKRKGSSHRLIDTGRLVNSITSEVRERHGEEV